MFMHAEKDNDRGTVASLIESHDWSTSPLGHPSTWPLELQTVVRLIVDSPIPMFVAWGAELGYLYNDAYLPILDAKHPAGFGCRLKDVWAEIWEDVRPLAVDALAGKSTFLEDIPRVIQRNGRAEKGWFTFAYSPIRTADKQVGGLYCSVTETTSRVLEQCRQAFQLRISDSLRPVLSPERVLETATRLIGEHFSVTRVGYVQVDGSKNVTVAGDWTDGTIATLVGQSFSLERFGFKLVDELRRGKTQQIDDIATDERSASWSESFASTGVRSTVIVPLLGAERFTAALYLQDARPRKWTADEVASAEDVARRTWEAVVRAHVEESLRDEARILELLHRTAKIVSSTLDLQDLVQSITDTATHLSGAAFGAFFYSVTDDQGEAMQLYTLSGAPREAFAKFGLPRPTALFGPTFAGAPTVRSGDITKDPRYGRSAPHYGMPAGHLEVRSYLATPVISRTGKTLGGLFFGHPAPDMFSERTERVVVGVAAQAAIAIDNAQLYESAQKAREEAERLARAKDELLSMLAHELRNPLAPISSAAKIIDLNGDVGPLVQAASRIINRQVTQMKHLLDAILDVSSVNHGLVTLDETSIDFKDVILDAIDQVRPLVDERKQDLSVHMPVEPVTVKGDPVRLVQIVANVLNNAAKYTHEGGALSVTLRTTGECLELSITDNGSGMPPELLPNVFDLFTQGKRSLARSQGGLGLGLALVKTLVELHGGTVTANSDGIGKGSRFVIRLPSHQAAEASLPLAGEELTAPAESAAQSVVVVRHVMVIDDNKDAADALALLLNAYGYEVSIAYTAESALEQVTELTPHAFLVDIGLPEMDGYELAGRLRNLPRFAKSALIAVTGYGEKRDRERAVAAGFERHLVKPVQLPVILDALSETIAVRR
jgi:signal transduction histidine kinase/CheY-like chemotaxis protein